MENKDFYQKEIILENSRVKLVPFVEQYSEGLGEIIFNDKELAFSVSCSTESDLEAYIDSTICRRNHNIAYPFVVIDKQTNEVAGSTSYGNIFFHNKRLEIGWTWYGKKFRGTGINKAAKFALLSYAFENMAFRRVQFSADIDNIRSQKAIVKLGAQKEGIFRANYVNSMGESRDDVYFSIIYSEWQEIKKTLFKEFV